MYKIVRTFMQHDSVVIATGLSLSEVKEHCSDSETSSTTATGEDAVALTALMGPWFDGYDKE